MICKFCLNSRKLSQSHIIPEFIFAECYNDKHRFIELYDVSKGSVRRAQTGYKERLLCAECEGRMNEWEKHARRLFVDPLPPHIPNSVLIREHSRLEYSKLKLFFLSILWRASVSSLPVFRHVALGPHEEAIRLMLESKDPGQSSAYPVLVFTLKFEGVHFRDFIVEPTPARFKGGRFYRFVLRGYVVFIYVASGNIRLPLPSQILDPDRPIRTVDSEFREFKFLREVWDRACESTKDIDTV